MAANENISESVPENQDNQKVSEYNPYEEFLDSNDDQHDTGNSESAGSVSEEKLFTDESDVKIPDFLNSGYEETAKKKRAFSSGLNSDEDSDIDDFRPDAFSPSVTQTETDASAEYSNAFSGTETGLSEKAENSTEKSDEVYNDEEDSDGSGGDTNDKDADIKYEKKESADDADRKPTGKPKVLNKKFLLSSIIIVLGSLILITFLMPQKSDKKDMNKKPVAERRASVDYSAFAKRRDDSESAAEKHYEEPEKKTDEKNNNDDEIPPIIPEMEKKPYTQNNINYNSGKSAGTASMLDIPDTRNDGLQAKRISGIKGLSSTQQSYSTDYQQTVAKNTTQGTARTQNFTMPSKEEYTSSVLNAYTKAYGNAVGNENPYAAQNDQAGKNSFYNNGRNSETAGQGEWLNLNTLWQGTIFEATLTSELNTDLPGEITARVAKNIYSSQDGRYLLIPQNSILYGTYNSSISYSQSRVQVVWNTLVRPDGYQIQLGSMNGTDAKGSSGLKGFVNDHPLAYLKAIGLMSVFSIVNSEFQNSMGNTNNEYVQNLLANSQSVTLELGDKLIDRAMNVQPTIKIKSGTKINIVVNQNLTIPPCEDIPVTQQYRRYR